jgi:DNA-binding NtrC family response regulator
VPRHHTREERAGRPSRGTVWRFKSDVFGTRDGPEWPVAKRSVSRERRTAGSVGEAFAALDGERFDLRVSDIALPAGSGQDFMRHGRDQVGLKGIAFSGFGTPDDVRESTEAGFSHHLTKPSSLHALVALIRRTAS